MERFIAPYQAWIYAAFRFVIGFLFLFHGLQKLFGWFGGQQPPVGSQLWVGGLLELVGGALVAAGLFTSWAAFLLSGMMAVAYFQFHFKFDFSEGNLWPIVNRGEAAVLYCFAFLLIAARGSGPLSVDAARGAS